MVGSSSIIGVALTLVGAVVALAPTATNLESPSVAWFVTALHDAGTTRTAVSALLVAAILLASLAFIRVSERKSRRTKNVFATVGAVLMGAGALVGVLSWFSGHLFVPVSRASIAVGQSIESVPTVQLGRTLKLMLPSRAQLLSLDTKAASATIRFSRAGESEGVEEMVHAAEPVVFGGYRIALVGFDYDPRHLAVTLTQSGEGKIPASGTVGTEVRFELDGPKYTIKRIERNHHREIGPSVELADEDGATFWAFLRGPEEGLQMTRGVKVTQVSTAPLAVFAISSSTQRPDPMVFSIILFLVGMTLFVGFPDPGRDSLNESGPANDAEAA